MLFHDLAEVKNIMGSVAERPSEDDPYYEDFRFFSAINCTTGSEYREELKSFLEGFIIGHGIFSLPEQVAEPYPLLVKLYRWL